jgi:hypothetical protein
LILMNSTNFSLHMSQFPSVESYSKEPSLVGNGKLLGKAKPNPALDTSLYEVEFEDGRVEAYVANQIAESIYAQVDDEGHQYSLLDEILDHKKLGDAISGDDAIIFHIGRMIPKKTTKGAGNYW